MKKSVTEKNYILLSCIIAATSMAMIMQLSGFLINGNKSLISGDMMNVYIPAIKNYLRDILGARNTEYTWAISLGIDTALINGYSVYSPFNLLFLLDGIFSDNAIVASVIIVKTGLAAVAFHLFIYNVYNVSRVNAIIFSVFYSLCAFQISYNAVNIIWMDSLFVLPLVFWAIHYYEIKNNIIPLLFVYTYIFISQFYMGYVIGISSFLYYVLDLAFRFVRKGGYKIAVNKLVIYMMAVICAFGISSFVWLPVIEFWRNNKAQDSSQFVSSGLTILDMYKQFFCGNLSTAYGVMPPVYCGIPVVFLTPLFFISKRFEKEDKTIYGIMIGILVLSFFVKFLYMMWHGFDYPDGWKYRFTFVLCFLLCVVSARASMELKTFNGLEIAIILILNLIILVLTCACDGDSKCGLFSKYMNLNATILILWCMILFFCIKTGNIKKSVVAIMMILTIFEVQYNGYNSFISKNTSTKLLYDVWKQGNDEIARLLEKNDFYRVNSRYDLGINSALYTGYNGISYFSSSENYAVRNEMGKLGLYGTPRCLLSYGLTPVTKMILGVKYDAFSIFADMMHETEENDEYHAKLIENDHVLNIGFMVAGDVNDYHLTNLNAFENNNQLLTIMTGENVEVFHDIPLDTAVIEEKGISLLHDTESYLLELTEEGDNIEKSITLAVPMDDQEVLAYIYNKESKKKDFEDYFRFEGGEEDAITNYGDLNVSYIKEMVSDNKYAKLIITREGNARMATFDDVFFSTYDSSELDKAYNILSENQLQIETFNNGYIKGHIDVTSDKHILYTSIPYSDEWKVNVDGVSAEINSILDGAFLAVNIPVEGRHDIEITFERRGEKTGRIITVTFTLLAIIFIAYENNKRVFKSHNTGINDI